MYNNVIIDLRGVHFIFGSSRSPTYVMYAKTFEVLFLGH